MGTLTKTAIVGALIKVRLSARVIAPGKRTFGIVEQAEIRREVNQAQAIAARCGPQEGDEDPASSGQEPLFLTVIPAS